MKVAKRKGELANPAGGGWSAVESTTVALNPVALESQPNEYIRASWQDHDYGQVAAGDVKPASDGDKLYLRVE